MRRKHLPYSCGYFTAPYLIHLRPINADAHSLQLMADAQRFGEGQPVSICLENIQQNATQNSSSALFSEKDYIQNPATITRRLAAMPARHCGSWRCGQRFFCADNPFRRSTGYRTRRENKFPWPPDRFAGSFEWVESRARPRKIRFE